MSIFNRFHLQIRAGLLEDVDLDSWERIIWFPQLEQGVSMERTPFDQMPSKGKSTPTLEPSEAAIRVEINQPSSSTYTPPTTQSRQSVSVPSRPARRVQAGQPPVAGPSHISTEPRANIEPELSSIAQPRIEVSEFVTRNHLWDVFRGKLISQQSAEPHAKTEKSVLVQLTYLHHFPGERLGPRPPYSNREERFTETQALEGIKRESKFYQKYGNSLKDVIPAYIGTYETSFRETQNGDVTVELYGMIFEDPGELVGDAWTGLYDDDVDIEIW
ncbi:hypothetical protein I302_106649 [Kwoniella bestiolae CBS 10118]|uniref:Uncharacterized protein n=1 Tax=Kwoniella bestiolae CBS 10118 TaxID=1296100 RepID=A0A1B9G0U2_9TREE|nr:hypothetical protein I302_06089 [Kwoniella bestiolae CBS 10118]OCF24628.1 hypothetical protein I302_06089 [Kwoniella bestiolae CBS 10118]